MKKTGKYINITTDINNVDPSFIQYENEVYKLNDGFDNVYNLLVPIESGKFTYEDLVEFVKCMLGEKNFKAITSKQWNMEQFQYLVAAVYSVVANISYEKSKLVFGLTPSNDESGDGEE